MLGFTLGTEYEIKLWLNGMSLIFTNINLMDINMESISNHH